jgi:hypothetical protein
MGVISTDLGTADPSSVVYSSFNYKLLTFCFLRTLPYIPQTISTKPQVATSFNMRRILRATEGEGEEQKSEDFEIPSFGTTMPNVGDKSGIFRLLRRFAGYERRKLGSQIR